MREPSNEQEVIALFCMEAVHLTDLEIISMQIKFPDAILNIRGTEYATEFEYVASNFFMHGHNAKKCSLIICWVNDWDDLQIAQNPQITIWELCTDDWKSLPIIGNKDEIISRLKSRLVDSEELILILKQQINDLGKIPNDVPGEKNSIGLTVSSKVGRPKRRVNPSVVAYLLANHNVTVRVAIKAMRLNNESYYFHKEFIEEVFSILRSVYDIETVRINMPHKAYPKLKDINSEDIDIKDIKLNV